MASPNLPESGIVEDVTTGHVNAHHSIHKIVNPFDLDALAASKGDLLAHDGSLLKRVAVGSDGQVLTADSAESLGVKWATPAGGGGGGGGNVPGWVEYLAEPDTPHADDDEFDDGSIAGAWTQVAVTGTITPTEARGVLSVVNTGQAGADAAGVLKSMGSLTAPVTVETALRAVPAQNFQMVGVGFTNGTSDSSNVSLLLWSVQQNTMRWQRGTLTSLDPNTNVTVIVSSVAFSHMYLRMIWKGTNDWAVAWSIDGVTWTRDTFAASNALTFAPTHMGLFATTWGGSFPGLVSFEYFRVYEADLTP